MEWMGIQFIGLNAENGRKLVLTVVLIAATLLMRAAFMTAVHLITRRNRNERFVFWCRQGASVVSAIVIVLAFLSIWFDDSQRLATGFGLFTAGLAFALQRVPLRGGQGQRRWMFSGHAHDLPAGSASARRHTESPRTTCFFTICADTPMRSAICL